jgi:hypothetical protein
VHLLAHPGNEAPTKTPYQEYKAAGGLPAPRITPEYKGVTGIDLLMAPDNAIIPSRLAQTTNPNNGKECGEYVNDCIGERIFGSSLESKLAVANEPTGKRGSAVVWVPDPNNKAFAQYGHMGIALWFSWDYVIVKSSNRLGDGRVSTELVPKSAILGYKSTNLA